MNYARLALAAFAASIVDLVYGFAVYGNLLTGEFARYPAIFRPVDAQMAYFPHLIAGIVIAMVAATYIYAKGYEGTGGAGEGVRFGLWVALFVVGYVDVVGYATMNLGRRLTGYLALASVAEWAIVGLTIGVVYRSAGAAPRPPGV
jgi:hypothetical protein